MAIVERELRNAILSGLATAHKEAEVIDIPFEHVDLPGGPVGRFKHIGVGLDPVSGKQLYVITFVFVTEQQDVIEAIDRRVTAMGEGGETDSS